MEIGDGISSSLLLLSRLHFCPSTTSNPTRTTKQSVVFARSVSSSHRLLLPPPLFVAGIVGRDPIDSFILLLLVLLFRLGRPSSRGLGAYHSCVPI